MAGWGRADIPIKTGGPSREDPGAERFGVMCGVGSEISRSPVAEVSNGHASGGQRSKP